MIILYATFEERFKMANLTVKVGDRNPPAPEKSEVLLLVQETSWVNSPNLKQVRVQELNPFNKQTLITTSANLLRSNGWGKRELIKWSRYLQSASMDESIDLVNQIVCSWDEICPKQ